VIKHLLLLIFRELENADKGQRDIESDRICPNSLADVQLPHKGVHAVSDVHKIAF
jgi:hypothetical protein